VNSIHVFVQVYVHMDRHTYHTTLILIVEKYISLKYIAYKIIIHLHICLKLEHGMLGRTKAWDRPLRDCIYLLEL